MFSIIWGTVMAWLVMWRKTTKTTVKLKSVIPDLNPGHANYKEALVTTQPQCLIQRQFICFYYVSVHKLTGWTEENHWEI